MGSSCTPILNALNNNLSKHLSELILRWWSLGAGFCFWNHLSSSGPVSDAGDKETQEAATSELSKFASASSGLAHQLGTNSWGVMWLFPFPAQWRNNKKMQVTAWSLHRWRDSFLSSQNLKSAELWREQEAHQPTQFSKTKQKTDLSYSLTFFFFFFKQYSVPDFSKVKNFSWETTAIRMVTWGGNALFLHKR